MFSVFAVSYGDYSDYTIERVFSTEDAAKAYVELANKLYGHNDREIEEWTVDGEGEMRAIQSGLFTYQVTVDALGSVHVSPYIGDPYQKERNAVYERESPYTRDVLMNPQTPPHKLRHHESFPIYDVHVEANNEDTARKIAFDKIAEYKASKEGIS